MQLSARRVRDNARHLFRNLLGALGVFVVAPAAQAHLVTTGLGPVYDGIGHLAMSPTDVLPVLALALLAGLRGPAAGRGTLAALPLAWLAGGLTGLLVSGAPAWPGDAGAAVIFVALGLLVAVDCALSPKVVLTLAAALGALHGLGNGVAMRVVGVRAGVLELIGVTTTLFVLVALIAAGVVMIKKPMGRVAVRVAGSWIAAMGVLLLGWSLRGSLARAQPAATAVSSSAGTPGVPPALVSPDARYTIGELLFSDDFEKDSGRWVSELEKGGDVKIAGGALTIDVPAGCTVWFKPLIEGPVMIDYEATAISAGGANDRVSDLNCFWMARDARARASIFDQTRSGKFADYNELLTYYVGLGGNTNTTTRFRRYIGDPLVRPLRQDDDRGAPEDLLKPNASQRLRLVASGSLIQFFRDDRKLFEMTDPQPYTSGWFALRTVTSHLVIKKFRVHRLRPIAPPAPAAVAPQP